MTHTAETKKLIVTDLSDVEPYGLCLLIDRGAGVLYYPIRDMDKETALILLSEYANTDPEHVAYADEAWLSDETEHVAVAKTCDVPMCPDCLQRHTWKHLPQSAIVNQHSAIIEPATVTEAASAAYGDYVAEHEDFLDWTQTRENDRPQ